MSTGIDTHTHTYILHAYIYTQVLEQARKEGLINDYRDADKNDGDGQTQQSQFVVSRCMHVCMYVRTYVHMYVCMYACMYESRMVKHTDLNLW